jgi:hypothetical protein
MTMAGRKAGPRTAGDYTIDLHLCVEGVSGAVWRCDARHPDGSTVSEHISDFPIAPTLNGALTVAERIIRLDRNGRKGASE